MVAPFPASDGAGGATGADGAAATRNRPRQLAPCGGTWGRAHGANVHRTHRPGPGGAHGIGAAGGPISSLGPAGPGDATGMRHDVVLVPMAASATQAAFRRVGALV